MPVLLLQTSPYKEDKAELCEVTQICIVRRVYSATGRHNTVVCILRKKREKAEQTQRLIDFS